jgi:hypothetical protein
MMLFLLPLLTLFSWSAEHKFGAKLDYESYYYGADLGHPTRTNDQILRFEPTYDVKFNKRTRITIKPTLRSNLSTKESPENFFFNPKEAYMEVKQSQFRVRLGENTYNWGAMEAYSPLDVVNGRTLFNPLAADKRGAGALDLLFEGKSFQIQALYIPYQARTLLPSTDSRWLPRNLLLNTVSGNDSLLLPPTFDYYYPYSEGITAAVQNNYGFKASARTGDFDFNAVFFEGSAITPQVRPIVTADIISINPNVLQARSDIGLIPVYYRQQTMGANIVWAPSDLIVRLESSYGKSLSDSTIVPPWLWQSALGIEKPTSLGSTSLTIIAQTYYAKNKDPIDNLVSSSNRLFDKAVVLGVRWAYSDDKTFLFSSLYNYKDHSYYLHLNYDWKITDHLKWTIGGDLLEGDPDTLLGTYNKNDRVTMLFSYFF